MVQDQRKLWVEVSIPKMNLPTRIMIQIQMININKDQKQILIQITPKKPELEGTDGGNVETDVVSPQEGASDDKSDEP